MRNALRTECKNGLYILAGLFFCALAYRLFLIPSNIAAGGFTGIAQLLNHLFALPIGMVSLALNLPLFLISMKSLGLRFGLRSLAATISFSLVLDMLQLRAPVNDMWLATVYGGLFSGLGFGLILRGSATTGGTDLLASLLHRMIPSLRVSIGIFLVDGLVIVASAFVFDPLCAMYALICTFISNVVVDFVLEGPNSSHFFLIVSDQSEEVARRILSELERGVTGLDGTGMYSGAPKRVLLCVVSRMETPRLRRIVFSTDPRAFLISTKARDAYGEGFRSIKQ